MTVFLQAATAFFAVIGMFEVLWQIILWFTRRALRPARIRILAETAADSDPAFLSEDLRLLEGRFLAREEVEVWLLCPPGAEQESRCEAAARLDERIRILPPERLEEEVRFFLADQ